MSLTATGVAVPPADVQAITNNGFWPDIEPEDFRLTQRLDGTATPERLKYALEASIRSTNKLLADYQSEQIADGVTGVAGIPLESWQIEGHHADLYKQAVYAWAVAWLMDRYTDITATGSRDDTVGEMKIKAADDYRRDASWAISELLGSSHVTVALI